MNETALKKLKDAIEAYKGSPNEMRAFMDGVVAAFEAADARIDKVWDKLQALDSRTLGSMVFGKGS